MKQLEQYKKVLEIGNKSKHTIRGYLKDINKLIKYFNIQDASELEKISVEEYHRFYGNQNLTENSIKGLVRNLSAFFAYLVDSGVISKDNSFSRVKFGKSKFPKVTEKKKVILSQEEAEMLIQAGRNLQEKFMFAMMLKTALRREEVCNIQMSDINGCTISLKSKGGSEDHETYLDDGLCSMLNEYLKERNTESEYLFYATRGFDGASGKLTGNTINKRVKSCVALSGIPKEKARRITAHTLRSFAITRMVLKNGLYAGQMLARHKSVETTKIYVNTGNEYVRELLLGE